MSALRAWLRVVGPAARIGFAEYRAHHTVRSWLSGWAVRVVFQVVYFTTAGVVIGDEDTVQYLAVGNIVAVLTLESAGAMMFIAGERRSGALPLMVASPGSHLVALLSRSLNAPLSGLLSSAVVFVLVVPLFDIPLPGAGTLLLLPVLLVCALSTYCYAACASALIVRFPNLNWFMLNMSYLILMAFAGINVPVSFWPAPIGAVANVLPVTHGLDAVRRLLDPSGTFDVAAVLADVALEVAVGFGWITCAAVAMHLLVENGRRSGALTTR